MPGIGSQKPQVEITKDRQTVVEFDIAEAVVLRPPWAIIRRGPQIAPATQAGAPRSSGVILLPSGSWGLKSFQHDARWERIEIAPGIIGLLQVLAANHIQEVRMQKRLPYPGLVYSVATGDTNDKTNNFLLARVPAGASWSDELFADATAFPKPTLDTQNVAMQRVVASAATYRPNQEFALRFYAPDVPMKPADTIATLYFGGPTDVAGASTTAGEHAISFGGSGLARLHERVGGAWAALWDFRYADPGASAGRMHNILVVPEGQDTLSVVAATTDAAQQPSMVAVSTPRAPRYPPSPHTNVFRASKQLTGYARKRTMTGAGPMRLDTRMDLRFVFQPSLLVYPTTGVLVDNPFFVQAFMPALTPIWLTMRVILPPGTSITATLHDAKTHVALVPNDDGSFRSVAGRQHYYPRFTLTGDGMVTPYLIRYEVRVQGARVERAPVTLTGGIPRKVSITGPDFDPSHESASVEIEDTLNSLELLRARANFHGRIYTRYDTNPANISILHEGVMTRAVATRKGRPRRAGMGGGGAAVLWPHEDWRHLDTAWVGMWARLGDQLNFFVRDFTTDPDAAPDPLTGDRPPYKLTSIIDTILDQIGVPSDQRDVPDLDPRAFASGRTAEEYFLQPMASPYEYARNMVKDYLGAYLLYDPNAGSRGKWRLRLVPKAPYTFLQEFKGTHPGAGKLPHAPGAYGAGVTFYNTLSSYVKPPEANYIVVTGTSEVPLPDQALSINRVQVAKNYKSFDFDPTTPTSDPLHPDYLGRFVPLVYYNPNLTSQAAVDWVCRRLYEQTATAQKWVKFRAPNVLVWDATDSHQTRPRPLRLYDAIKIDGNPALIRSTEITIESDFRQWIDIEALTYPV